VRRAAASRGRAGTNESHGAAVSLVVIRAVVEERVWVWALDKGSPSLVFKLLLFALLRLMLVAVLSGHHGKGCGSQACGQAALDDVFGIVSLSVGELDKLVGGEGGGGEADGEVDALAEANFLEGVEAVMVVALIVVGHLMFD